MSMMRAAGFVERGRIELADKPIPDVAPNDALIRITITTICGTDGAQAEYLLVPDAQGNLAPIPDGLTDEQVLMCPDIMSTGFKGAENAHIRIGDVVAVFAQGPIGLCATAGARLQGASTIIVIDGNDHRLGIARQMGADATLNFHNCDVVDEIMTLTGGQSEHQQCRSRQFGPGRQRPRQIGRYQVECPREGILDVREPVLSTQFFEPSLAELASQNKTQAEQRKVAAQAGQPRVHFIAESRQQGLRREVSGEVGPRRASRGPR